MPKILIQNLNNKLIISNHISKNILRTIHENGQDWMHACGAKGRCTTCKMIVLEGQEHLSLPSRFEQQCIDRSKLRPNERLACQCTTEGDIVIKVPDAYKLPHINYTD